MIIRHRFLVLLAFFIDTFTWVSEMEAPRYMVVDTKLSHM